MCIESLAKLSHNQQWLAALVFCADCDLPGQLLTPALRTPPSLHCAFARTVQPAECIQVYSHGCALESMLVFTLSIYVLGVLSVELVSRIHTDLEQHQPHFSKLSEVQIHSGSRGYKPASSHGHHWS